MTRSLTSLCLVLLPFSTALLPTQCSLQKLWLTLLSAMHSAAQNCPAPTSSSTPSSTSFSTSFTTSSSTTVPSPTSTPFFYNCTGRTDGNYLHPTLCTHFVSCSGGRAIDMFCPLADNQGNLLRYNSTINACDYPRDTACQCASQACSD